MDYQINIKMICTIAKVLILLRKNDKLYMSIKVNSEYKLYE